MAKPVQKKPGRPKGSKDKRTWEIEKLAQDLGCNPFEILLKIAMNDWEGLGYKEPELVTTDKDGNISIKERITMDHRLYAAKEAAQYLFPKRKAVEFSGQVERVDRVATKEELYEALETDVVIEVP